jgi:TPR repeat protein
VPAGESTIAQDQISRGEQLFLEASALDAGDEASRRQAEALYRQALIADPCLVAALINLGNLHYIEGHLPEALALYAQACIAGARLLRGALQPGERTARRRAPRGGRRGVPGVTRRG